MIIGGVGLAIVIGVAVYLAESRLGQQQRSSTPESADDELDYRSPAVVGYWLDIAAAATATIPLWWPIAVWAGRNRGSGNERARQKGCRRRVEAKREEKHREIQACLTLSLIKPASQDSVTRGTKEQIVEHNEHGEQQSCW